MRRTIHDVLTAARAQLDRLEPERARRAVAEDGALIVDIRDELQREREGVVPGAIHVPRNVLEWRLDPDSGAADPRIGGLGRRIVVMCDGGYQAWRDAGLPVEPAGPELR